MMNDAGDYLLFTLRIVHSRMWLVYFKVYFAFR